jgi:hypothetical protein
MVINGIPRGDSITMAIESPRGIASIVASPSLSKLMLTAPGGSASSAIGRKAIGDGACKYVIGVIE